MLPSRSARREVISRAPRGSVPRGERARHPLDENATGSRQRSSRAHDRIVQGYRLDGRTPRRDIDVRVAPPPQGHAVRFVSEADESRDPGFSELEVSRTEGRRERLTPASIRYRASMNTPYRVGVEPRVRIVVTTGNEIAGHRIVDYLGVARHRRPVAGHRPGASSAPSSKSRRQHPGVRERLRDARHQAYVQMLEHAESLGADAIIGMRYDATDSPRHHRGPRVRHRGAHREA